MANVNIGFQQGLAATYAFGTDPITGRSLANARRADMSTSEKMEESQAMRQEQMMMFDEYAQQRQALNDVIRSVQQTQAMLSGVEQGTDKWYNLQSALDSGLASQNNLQGNLSRMDEVITLGSSQFIA